MAWERHAKVSPHPPSSTKEEGGGGKEGMVPLLCWAFTSHFYKQWRKKDQKDVIIELQLLILFFILCTQGLELS